jgi:signal transduction histidine kinase
MKPARWFEGRAGLRPSRRAQLIDLALTVPFGAFAVIGTRGAASAADPGRRPLDALAFVLVLLAAAGLGVRRRWPLATLAVTASATAVYLGREYTYGPVIVLMAFAMLNAAMRLPVRISLPACGVAIAVLFTAGLAHVDLDRLFTDGLTLVGQSAWLLVPWALGTVVQGRREAASRIQHEARSRYATEQRLEIARDVHDVVGHGLAVINMQAGIALHVLEKRPEQAAIALDAIKRTSKEALEELRATLAVYRSDDPAPRRPTPGLDQLDGLVATTVQSGLPVELTVVGDPVELPASVDLAGYRIVQESLTNILRHAGPASARVRVVYEPAAVRIDVTDDGRGTPAGPGGHGIVGMRERAEAVGGTVQAGPRAAGGFSVQASLPVGE